MTYSRSHRGQKWVTLKLILKVCCSLTLEGRLALLLSEVLVAYTAGDQRGEVTGHICSFYMYSTCHEPVTRMGDAQDVDMNEICFLLSGTSQLMRNGKSVSSK